MLLISDNRKQRKINFAPDLRDTPQNPPYPVEMIERTIRAALRSRDKDQRWLARQIGSSDDKVSKSLNGRRDFTLEELAKISGLLDVDLGIGIAPAAEATPEEVEARLEFGGRLAEERERFGRTVAQAARGICNPDRWSDLEAGHASPSLVEIDLICARLSETADYLVRGIERAKIPKSAREAQTMHEESGWHFSDNRK